MCTGSPLPFQHPGPVGCSPAVLHLCSEHPGASEAVVLLRVPGRDLEEESKVGQERLTGAAEDEQSGPRMLSLPNQMPVPMFQGPGVHVGE